MYLFLFYGNRIKGNPSVALTAACKSKVTTHVLILQCFSCIVTDLINLVGNKIHRDGFQLCTVFHYYIIYVRAMMNVLHLLTFRPQSERERNENSKL